MGKRHPAWDVVEKAWATVGPGEDLAARAAKLILEGKVKGPISLFFMHYGICAMVAAVIKTDQDRVRNIKSGNFTAPKPNLPRKFDPDDPGFGFLDAYQIRGGKPLATCTHAEVTGERDKARAQSGGFTLRADFLEWVLAKVPEGGIVGDHVDHKAAEAAHEALLRR